jgi:hypothetical protein
VQLIYAALYTPQAPKSAAAVPEPQKVPEPIFWVKCDECDRWRIINGLTVEEQTKLMKKSWFCRMHPDVAQRECDKVVSCAVMGTQALCDPARAGQARQELALHFASGRSKDRRSPRPRLLCESRQFVLV